MFNDSEDERTTALNDGFEVIEVDRSKDGTNKVKIKGKSYRIKVCITKLPLNKSTPKKKKLNLVAPIGVVKFHKTKDAQRMDEGENQYMSDELGSSDLNAFEDEIFPKYAKFRKEQ